jgi:hypothetical protein
MGSSLPPLTPQALTSLAQQAGIQTGVGPATTRRARTFPQSLAPWFDTSLAKPRVIYNDGVRSADASGSIIVDPFAQTVMDDASVTNFWRMNNLFTTPSQLYPNQVDQKGGLSLTYDTGVATQVNYGGASQVVGSNDPSIYFQGQGRLYLPLVSTFNWQYNTPFGIGFVINPDVPQSGSRYVLFSNFDPNNGNNGWEISLRWSGTIMQLRLDFVGGTGHTNVFAASATTVPNGVSQFCYIGYDGTYCYMFVNGVWQTPVSMTGIGTNSLTSTVALSVGSRSGRLLGYIGNLDEVFVQDSTQNPVYNSLVSAIPLPPENAYYLSAMQLGYSQLGQLS